MIDVELFALEHADGFRALFEAASSSCFCRYWHFAGNKNEWLDRCAHRPEENLADQLDALRRGDESAYGLVALGDHDGERAVIGWMKLTPREFMPKLTSLPVYRALEAELKTWTVGCFVVDPSARRRGVARALLLAAEGHVLRAGGLAIEGHPRRSSEPLHDEEAWQGPERLFVELGYEPVHDVAPYPVYRKLLARSPS